MAFGASACLFGVCPETEQRVNFSAAAGFSLAQLCWQSFEQPCRRQQESFATSLAPTS